MYIFYKIYLQWIYWILVFIACYSMIFASEPPELMLWFRLQDQIYSWIEQSDYTDYLN